jgi:hypothetical protein
MRKLKMTIGHTLKAMKVRFVLLALITSLTTIGGCASADIGRKIDFELTGMVLDAVTKQPIEGAYVIAGYRIWIEGAHDRPDRCVKDGKYHFPVEKLDGLSPVGTSAIKPGYFRGGVIRPERDVWQKQGAAAYAGHDLFLKPQDAAKPVFEFAYGGDDICRFAKTREDAAAAIEFLKIEIAEITRLGAQARGVEATRQLLERLESLPSAADPKK